MHACAEAWHRVAEVEQVLKAVSARARRSSVLSRPSIYESPRDRCASYLGKCCQVGFLKKWQQLTSIKTYRDLLHVLLIYMGTFQSVGKLNGFYCTLSPHF